MEISDAFEGRKIIATSIKYVDGKNVRVIPLKGVSFNLFRLGQTTFGPTGVGGPIYRVDSRELIPIPEQKDTFAEVYVLKRQSDDAESYISQRIVQDEFFKSSN